jgi:hypothetical protein
MPATKRPDPIYALLTEKAMLKQHVFDNTLASFQQLKTVLADIALKYNNQLVGHDKRIHLEYQDKGEFVATLKVAGDTLVFYMHSNAFEFDRDHKIWQHPYVLENQVNSYVGQIHVYNFLSDSFRYNRTTDAGYLIARIFINRENHFFVEGKRQKGMSLQSFAKSVLNVNALTKICEVAILYSLQFDLLVQPYENVSIISSGTSERRNNELAYENRQTFGFPIQ